MLTARKGSRLINGICLRSTRGLSPAKRSAAQFAAEFSAGGGDIRLGCGMILGKMDE